MTVGHRDFKRDGMQKDQILKLCQIYQKIAQKIYYKSMALLVNIFKICEKREQYMSK